MARSSVSPVRAELVGAYAVDVCSAPAQPPLDAAINVRRITDRPPNALTALTALTAPTAAVVDGIHSAAACNARSAMLYCSRTGRWTSSAVPIIVVHAMQRCC